MKFLILTGPTAEDVEKQFAAYNSFFEDCLDIPRPGTLRYAGPIEHPVLNKIAIPVTDPAQAFLIESEVAALVTFAGLNSGGFFLAYGAEDPSAWQQFKGWFGF